VIPLIVTFLFSLRLAAMPVGITAIVSGSPTVGKKAGAAIFPVAQNNFNQRDAIPVNPGGQSANELEIPPVVPEKQPNSPANSKLPEIGLIPPNGDQSTREIPLPKVFQGCWEGQVTHLDSLRALGGHPPDLWITKTYRFCYRRIAQGPFVPTLATAGVDSHSVPTGAVSSVRSTLRVLQSDGRSSVALRAFLEFSQPYSEFGVLGGPVLVDELTDMNGRLEGDVMHVQARIYAERNRSPWCIITWHADFVHAPN
jgi:hypothetical protein